MAWSIKRSGIKKIYLKSFPLLLLLVFVVLFSLWLYPKAAGSFFFLRALRGADLLMAQYYNKEFNSFECQHNPFVEPGTRSVIERSIGDLSVSIQNNPKLASAYLWLGRLNCVLGNYEEAASNYSTYVSVRPKNPLGYLELGFVVERLVDRESAMLHWRKAGVDPIYFEKNARYYINQNNASEAIDWIERASWFYPERSDLMITMGDLLSEIHAPAKASEAYIKAYEISPTAGTLPLANFYFQEGKEQESEFLLRSSLDEYRESIERINWWTLLGENLVTTKKWDAAIDVFSEAINEFSGEPDLYISLGWAYYEKYQGVEPALEQFKKAILIDGGRGKGYYAAGLLFYQEGEYEEAEKWFFEAVQREPDMPWYVIMHANNLRSSGKVSTSIELYEGILEKNPSYHRAYFELSIAFYDLGEIDQAREYILNAIHNAPSPTLAYFNRAGLIYEALEDYEMALNYFEQSLELSPNNPTALEGYHRVSIPYDEW
jgi:tetratricopeptide (TPR) repeat protein